VAMSGGPASMEKTEFTAAVEAMGSSIGGSNDYDYAALSMSTIVPYFDETWVLFAETVTNPAFRESEIELRREQSLIGIRTEMDDPGAALGTLAKEIAFVGHAYSIRPQGTEETIGAVTPEDLRGAYDALLVKSRMMVVVVGNVERSQVEALVASAFGDLPNYILGYFAAPPTAHEDYPALQAALEILSDRLFEEVRTRRNLSYAVASGISDRRNATGYLYVTAEDANTTIQVMYDTIDGMIDPGVDAQDLQDQIEGYLTRYYRGLQSNAAQAGMLGRWELVGGGRENADIHVERLGEVTAEDISRVLRTYVTHLQFAIVGDPAAIDTALFADR
jgi:zinc protease